MSGPVVFAFAVADGVLPATGAAPPDVLARQLPRLLVARLNGDGDRGARFFPFLGVADGRRRFLRLQQLLEPAALAQLHQQGDVRWLCDGLLVPGGLHWRLIDGRTQQVRFARELPFDPRAPFEILPRLEFEIVDRLDLEWRPQPLPRLAGEALGWWLVLKDELLKREANLADEGHDALRSARICLDLAAAAPEVQQSVCEHVASLLRRGERREECAVELARLAARCDDPDRLARVDALLLAAGAHDQAAAVACRAARLAPGRVDLVERAAAQAFQLGRYDDVRDVVGRARACGAASSAALAQLAAACDRLAEHAARNAIVRELVGKDDLPVPVARLVASFLLEEDQPTTALAVVDRALAKAPDLAMLHFERARACLLLGDEAAATTALQRALAAGLAPTFVGQAQRFLRVLARPGLWSGLRSAERALAAGQVDLASIQVRKLVRTHRRAAEAWHQFGLVAHQRGRLRAAERAMRRAIACDGSCGEAHNRLGVLLLLLGRADDGHAHLLRAHELAPHDTSPLLHLAQAEAVRGQRAAAEAYLAAAVRLGADPQLLAAVQREVAARGA
jgi:tetratricopeptide (TPR) repeat protein